MEQVRIVLGWEPNRHGRKKYPLIELKKEIKEYWLKEGLSIIYGGAVMKLIDLIKNGKIKFKYRDKLHAKIYVGNTHAILGSANFSVNGLTKQEEANIRVDKTENEHEKPQYQNISSIAEKFYDLAEDYNEEAIELFKGLIQKVSWQEALARAISEVIEGDWLRDYEELFSQMSQSKLWPTQWQAISQAMNILQNQSNVLVADPTGAGKTKLTSALMLTLIHWLWENGRQDRTNSVVVCPPLVKKNWQHEFVSLSRLDHNQISMGLLSSSTQKNRTETQTAIQLANITVLDEAHNYLNPDSNRSKLIQNRQADHTLLLTATPMNKKADDLLRLIELLDIDNLSDKDFAIYKELKTGRRKIDSGDLETLKGFISQFLVRRTKSNLNKEIDKAPEKYLNRLGNVCRFPKQISKTYATQETKFDIDIAHSIKREAENLKGLIYLKTLHRPNWELKNREEEQAYINKRLSSAKALSMYMIMSALRSSHVALLEHVAGTDAALAHFEIKSPKNISGNQIGTVENMKSKLPKRSFDAELFPSWLTHLADFQFCCDEEMATYRRIAALAKKLSGERERGKVLELINLQGKHPLVVAFDSTVITLQYFKSLFEKEKCTSTIHVVAGNTKSARDKVLELFKLGSNAYNHIALCSDQMAEGVNMQQASSVMLLDLPSVLRIVEQRIGRIDRMDSPYKEIEIYWPDDSEIFSLKGDQRLVEISNMAEDIYGSNITLPKELRDKHFKKTKTIKGLINQYEEYAKSDHAWEGMHHSFRDVINLKEGRSALIEEAFYDQIKEVQASIKCRVSFTETESSWCFFALKGSKTKSPRWYFIDHEENLHTEYPEICKQLRNHLKGKCADRDWNAKALGKFIKLMRKKEIEMLPNKRKRAIEVARAILESKLKKTKDAETRRFLNENIKLLKPNNEEVIVDFYEFAKQWIDVLKPFVDNKRALNKRKRNVYNLSSLRRDYMDIDIDNTQLRKIATNCPYTDRIDNKIAACIIGVP
ncbi:hypothetical protein GC194_08140 [bacterium]|nr:hypothetical protein [bacterium]